MPNVSQFRRPRITRAEPLFLFDTRRPQTAASADMIDKIITHADLTTRLAGGRLKLRLSAQMIEALQAQGRLAPGDYRLADLTVVWDETEGQVVNVRDDARIRDAAAHWAEWDALWDEDSYADETPRSVAA